VKFRRTFVLLYHSGAQGSVVGMNEVERPRRMAGCEDFFALGA